MADKYYHRFDWNPLVEYESGAMALINNVLHTNKTPMTKLKMFPKGSLFEGCGIRPKTDKEIIAEQEKKFLRILETTTLWDRLFGDGPRALPIQFDKIQYEPHDGNGNTIPFMFENGADLAVNTMMGKKYFGADFGTENHADDAFAYAAYTNKPEEENTGRFNLWPQSPSVKLPTSRLQDLKPKNNVREATAEDKARRDDRVNMFPDKKEMAERRAKRMAEILEETTKISIDVLKNLEERKREKIYFYEGGQRLGKSFLQKVYIKDLDWSRHKVGALKTEENKPIPAPFSYLDEERRLRGLLREIETFPTPSEVMKREGNEWTTYSQALEKTIKIMREIASKAKPF